MSENPFTADDAVKRFLIGTSQRQSANGNHLFSSEEYRLDAAEHFPSMHHIVEWWTHSMQGELLPNVSAIDSLFAHNDNKTAIHLIDVQKLDPNTYYVLRTANSVIDLDTFVKDFAIEAMKEAMLASFSTASILRRGSFTRISIGTSDFPKQYLWLILPLRTPDQNNVKCSHLLFASTETQPKEKADSHKEPPTPVAIPINPGNKNSAHKQDYDADLAILEHCLMSIRPALPKNTAVHLLNKFGNLPEVISASPDRLAIIGDLSEQHVALIKAATEIAARIIRHDLASTPLVDNPKVFGKYCLARLGYLSKEAVLAILVDHEHFLIHDEIFSLGSPRRATLEIPQFIRLVQRHKAAGFFLAHNHPTNDPTPSQSDISLTSELERVSLEYELSFHDHLIVTRNTTVSLRALNYFRGRSEPTRP